jgi:hypothetical protein
MQEYPVATVVRQSKDRSNKEGMQENSAVTEAVAIASL